MFSESDPAHVANAYTYVRAVRVTVFANRLRLVLSPNTATIREVVDDRHSNDDHRHDGESHGICQSANVNDDHDATDGETEQQVSHGYSHR